MATTAVQYTHSERGGLHAPTYLGPQLGSRWDILRPSQHLPQDGPQRAVEVAGRYAGPVPGLYQPSDLLRIAHMPAQLAQAPVQLIPTWVHTPGDSQFMVQPVQHFADIIRGVHIGSIIVNHIGDV